MISNSMSRFKRSLAQGALALVAFATVGFLTTEALAQSSPFIIKLGEARTKKSLTAFPALQFTGTPASAPKYQSVGAEIFETIVNDLTASSYFEFMAQKAFLEDPAKTGLRPKPEDPNGFSFATWQEPLKTDFLIRGAFSLVAGEINLEIYLYHVPKEKLVMGKKYKGPMSTARKIAHTFSNDVLEALTGVRGPFISRIAVASDRGGHQWKEIYVMDWDGANVEKITNLKTLAISPAWSPDNKKIAYTAAVQRKRGQPRNHDLFIYDMGTGRSNLVSFRQGMNSGATFSPDGQTLFLTVSQGNSPDIYKINYNGDLLLRMTNGPNGAMNVEPAVSPDGTKIAFASDRSGRTMIFSMNSTSGGDIKRLTQAGQFNASPAWSPDGKKIAFAGFETDHFDIFVMNADGTGMIRLTQATKKNGHAANNEDPSFSPDGRYVMYTSNRTGKNQIFIAPVDGSEERQITTDNSNYFKPRWSGSLE